jgi:hypothetical protein
MTTMNYKVIMYTKKIFSLMIDIHGGELLLVEIINSGRLSANVVR